MSIFLSNFYVSPRKLSYNADRAPQKMTVNWDETFSAPGHNNVLYALTISVTAAVTLNAVYIPDLKKNITLAEYRANPGQIPYVITFNEKVFSWYEDAELANKREMDIYLVITKAQTKEKVCDVNLEVIDNYIPGQPPLPSQPETILDIFQYQ